MTKSGADAWFGIACALALGLFLLIAETLSADERLRVARYSFLIAEISGPASGIADVLVRLESLPGVADARLLTGQEAAAALSVFGGDPIDPADLADLRLAEVRLAPAAATPEARLDLEISAAGAGLPVVLYGPDANAPLGGHGLNLAAQWVLAGMALALMAGLAGGKEADVKRLAYCAQLGLSQRQAIAPMVRAGAERGFLIGLIASVLGLISWLGLLHWQKGGLSSDKMDTNLSPAAIALALAMPLAAMAFSALAARRAAVLAFDRGDRPC
jgi:hypothetical protein